MSTTGQKVAYGVLGIGVVAGLAYALSGDAYAASSKRDPWTEPLILPGDDEAWSKVKTVICTCGRGGATGMGLLVCTLDRVYEGVPWAEIVESGPVAGDDASVGEVIAQIGKLVVEYDELEDETARALWCVQVVVVGPIIPPKPGPAPPAPTDYDKRKTLLGQLVHDEPTGGGFYQIVAGDSGVAQAAQRALTNAGVDWDNGMSFELAKAFSASMWNQIYAKKSDSIYGVGGWFVGPAWLPRHQDARKRILEGFKPKKTIKSNGNKTGGGNKYGMPWVPGFDLEAAQQGIIVITQPEPPEALLALLK